MPRLFSRIRAEFREKSRRTHCHYFADSRLNQEGSG